MIYYLKIYTPDKLYGKTQQHYRDDGGWIYTYFIRRKKYGRFFEEYGYLEI